MVQHAIADHHSFVAGVHTDVHVQTKGDQTAYYVLHQGDQPMIAFVNCDFLMSPGRERVCAGPQQANTHGVQNRFQLRQFGSQIIAGFAYSSADFGIDFDVALHQFRLDRLFQVFRDGRKNLINAAAQ